MKELSLNIKSVRVEAESRDVRAEWNREMLFDFQGIESYNFEKELKQIVSSMRAGKRKNSIKKIFKF